MGCEKCGAPTKVFASSGRSAKFCEAHGGKEAKPIKALPERACPACGTPFVPGHGSQKFCSANCRSGKKNKKSGSADAPEKKKPGRPEHVPTAVSKKKVATAAGGGMPHEDIALGLGISKSTLEKHYEFELSTGAYGKRLEVVNAMHKAAKKGNVAAQKAYLVLDPKLAVPPLPKGDEPPAKPPEIGKKAQANADAVTAGQGGEWGELLAPAKPTTH